MTAPLDDDRLPARLGGVVPPMTRTVRLLFVGVLLSALGSGLSMPFLYVYLTDVRGFDSRLVGLMFAAMGAVAVLAAPVGGWLIDHVGPRWVLFTGLLVEGLCMGAMAFVPTLTAAYALTMTTAVAGVMAHPAFTAMLTRLVRREERERVYGFQFLLLNLGLGTGAMASSFLVASETLAAYQRLYLVDAVTYLAYLVVIVALPAGTGALERAAVTSVEQLLPGDTWLTVLRDTVLLRVVLVSVLGMTVGYAQMDMGFPAYAHGVADVPPSALGWAFGANTAVIVLAQTWALGVIQGRRHASMLSLTWALWGVSWAVVASSALLEGPWAAAAVITGLGLFGLGEVFQSPVMPAVVNDLATEELRGRYNAMGGLSWTLSSILGPALAGWMIGSGHAFQWVVLTVGGCAVVALLWTAMRPAMAARMSGRIGETAAETA
ncbi:MULTISPECIES: MFS transporter [Kytococcus]|uniref:MFS transporter n=1 Tax=Kytococcus schroeteri TaxID=138300 RepID=A0A2I1P903_9MICO|nr:MULTISPECIES: MFS transporter [Kytococcus]OFS15357.1 hypothetical protein HMPREF3099_02240 [Kytococcus sp. HMSC28H12]PKZ41114.1 MFS transporter [Kytococcus schroeteri]